MSMSMKGMFEFALSNVGVQAERRRLNHGG